MSHTCYKCDTREAFGVVSICLPRLGMDAGTRKSAGRGHDPGDLRRKRPRPQLPEATCGLVQRGRSESHRRASWLSFRDRGRAGPLI